MCYSSFSLSTLFYFYTLYTHDHKALNIYLQNILVLINLNHINPEFSGPNLNYTLVIN